MAVTTTEITYGSVKKVTFSWTSDASGDATGTTSNVFDGVILLFGTNPGSTAPTDDYDVTLTDADGWDLLAGQGADRDTANTEYVNSGMGGVAKSALTLTVANAGDSKVGEAVVFIR